MSWAISNSQIFAAKPHLKQATNVLHASPPPVALSAVSSTSNPRLDLPAVFRSCFKLALVRSQETMWLKLISQSSFYQKRNPLCLSGALFGIAKGSWRKEDRHVICFRNSLWSSFLTPRRLKQLGTSPGPYQRCPGLPRIPAGFQHRQDQNQFQNKTTGWFYVERAELIQFGPVLCLTSWKTCSELLPKETYLTKV